MEQIFLRKRALALWQEGQRCQLDGDINRAIELYTDSLAVFPTAEAHTFRAWAYSSLNQLDEAIEECKKAIAVDPSFGNAYDDLGSYLVLQGKLDEALTWFERAKVAPRLEPRHLPYLKLGRLFASRGMVTRAIREFEAAQRLCPNDPFCREALVRLNRRVN